MSKDRVRKDFWIERRNAEYMHENLELANVRSENEFVNQALDFYIGFLKTKDTESYLLNTISSVLHSTIEMSEERIIKYVYKMAVEQAVLNRIIGIENRMTEQEFEEILEAAQREVKRF